MDRDVYQQRQDTEVTSDSIHLPSWSIEQEVNGLMDDLFGDIDRTLDRGGVLPTEPVQPESVAVKPLDIPSMKLPPAIAESLARSSPELASLASTSAPPPALDLIEDTAESDRSSSIEMSDLEEIARFDEIDEIAQLDNSFFADDPIQLAEPPEPPAPPVAHSSVPWWDRLLLFTIGGAIAIPFGLWLSRQPGWEFAREKLGAPSESVGSSLQSDRASEEPPRVDGQAQILADREFAQYMQRSLQLREELQGDAETTLPAPPVDIDANLETDETPPKPTTVLERVYIPVYQPTPPTATSDSVTPEVAPPPAVPEEPVENAEVTPEVAPPPIPVPPTPAEPAGVVLTGILELGDRSAALFEIEGVSRRFQVGEAIASSGWTLVQIADREAIIRRNGEVRSIFVGEMF